jgi:hypothetical protein
MVANGCRTTFFSTKRIVLRNDADVADAVQTVAAHDVALPDGTDAEIAPSAFTLTVQQCDVGELVVRDQSVAVYDECAGGVRVVEGVVGVGIVEAHAADAVVEMAEVAARWR